MDGIDLVESETSGERAEMCTSLALIGSVMFRPGCWFCTICTARGSEKVTDCGQLDSPRVVESRFC